MQLRGCVEKSRAWAIVGVSALQASGPKVFLVPGYSKYTEDFGGLSPVSLSFQLWHFPLK